MADKIVTLQRPDDDDERCLMNTHRGQERDEESVVL